MRIAVFVSGRGSNLQAILDSQTEYKNVEVNAVFSDKVSCKAFQIAEKFSIPTFSIGNKDGCVSYPELPKILSKLEIEFIVLAGFLKLIPNDLIREFKNRIINIHPALLPSFGGKGMYGKNIHTAVFDSSAKVSGVTIHFVDETYDTGKIIAQRCVDIKDVKSPDEIAERVLRAEHELLPFIINKFAEGKVNIIENRISVL